MPNFKFSPELLAAVREQGIQMPFERTGLVSERLWRLVTDGNDGVAPVPARWLGEAPDAVWDIVRDALLRCS